MVGGYILGHNYDLGQSLYPPDLRLPTQALGRVGFMVRSNPGRVVPAQPRYPGHALKDGLGHPTTHPPISLNEAGLLLFFKRAGSKQRPTDRAICTGSILGS